MKKIFCLSFLIIGLLIGITAEIEAADMTMALDTTDGSTAFLVTDSAATTMASIDSDGNLQIQGGMRLDTSGTENTTAETLIVDGSIGIGTASPTAFLHQAAVVDTTVSGNVPAGSAPTSPVEGDYWNDSTQKANIDFIDGINQSRVGCIFTQTATATVANTTTETTLVSTGIGIATLPANFFVAGKTIRITASGVYSNVVTIPTLQLRVGLGGIAGTVVLDTGANSSGGKNMSNRFWQVDGIITCRTTGASGTVFSQGQYIQASSAVAAAIRDMENTTTSTIDTTAGQQIVVSMAWGIADAGDTISCTNLVIEVLN